MLFIVQTTLQLGLIYGLVSLALFVSYRILNIADLSTDGTFVLGMCVSVAFAYNGHPILALFMAILSGALSGTITAYLQTYLEIPSILAGIITNTGLYTINLMIMNYSSNLALLKQETVFSILENKGINNSSIILPALIFILISTLLYLFLKTRLGLSIRATGDNTDMVLASSIDARKTTIIGLAIANSITSLSGGLVGQFQRTADINSGTGVVVIGLACLIIGESIISKDSILKNILATLIGSIIYRLLYAIILRTRIFPIEFLKLITAFIITIAIGLPSIRKTIISNTKEKRHA